MYGGAEAGVAPNPALHKSVAQCFPFIFNETPPLPVPGLQQISQSWHPKWLQLNFLDHDHFTVLLEFCHSPGFGVNTHYITFTFVIYDHKRKGAACLSPHLWCHWLPWWWTCWWGWRRATAGCWAAGHTECTSETPAWLYSTAPARWHPTGPLHCKLMWTSPRRGT